MPLITTTIASGLALASEVAVITESCIKKADPIFWTAFVFPMSLEHLNFGSRFPFRFHFFAPLLGIFVVHLFHVLRDIRMFLHDVLRHGLYHLLP